MLAGRSHSFLPFCFWVAAFLPQSALAGRRRDIGAAFCRCAMLCVLTLNVVACSSTQTYYKNRFFTDNVQQRLNIDLSYCDAVAKANTPIVVPQMPQYPTTTHGNGVMFDNRGNLYNLTYNSSTEPSPYQFLQTQLNNFSMSSRASSIYSAIKNKCLAEKGWYEISKEEYEQSRQPQQKYYKSPFYTHNVQQRLTIDSSYCEVLARQRNDFRLKDICLAEKGWIEISKEEHDRILQMPQQKYYKNPFYVYNVQQRLDIDFSHCENLAKAKNDLNLKDRCLAEKGWIEISKEENDKLPQKYYKNRFFTDNTQQRLSIDLPYCEEFAKEKNDFRLRDKCLAKKGWIEISKEEHEQSLQRH